MYCSQAFYGNSFNLIIQSTHINNYTAINSKNWFTESPFRFYYCNGTGDVTFTTTYPEVVSLRGMFEGSNNFNGSIQKVFNAFPNVTNCCRMLVYCSNFNRPVTIPNSVTSCIGMFSSCHNLNSTITIGSNVTDCSSMFSGCYNFNGLVTFSNSVTNCVYMFSSCYNFNRPVTIPNSVTNCENMFVYCNNLRSKIIIGSGVLSTRNMFQAVGTINFNVVVESFNVDCSAGMFSSCTLNGASVLFGGFNDTAQMQSTFRGSIINSNITVTGNMKNGNGFIFSSYISNSYISFGGDIGGNAIITSPTTNISIADTTISCHGAVTDYMFDDGLSIKNTNNVCIEIPSAYAQYATYTLNRAVTNGNIYTKNDGDTNNNGYTYKDNWYYTSSGYEYVPYDSLSKNANRHPIITVIRT